MERRRGDRSAHRRNSALKGVDKFGAGKSVPDVEPDSTARIRFERIMAVNELPRKSSNRYNVYVTRTANRHR